MNLTKNNRYKYIFCDINLDYAEEGFDIVKIHKKRRLKSKIIAFTSSDFNPELIKAKGFDFFLDKKFNHVSEFMSTIVV